MTNNSLKRLAELAGRFEKLAQVGGNIGSAPGQDTPGTSRALTPSTSNTGSGDTASLQQLSQEPTTLSSTDVLGQIKEITSLCQKATREFEYNNTPNLVTLKSYITNLKDVLNTLKRSYGGFSVQMKSKINSSLHELCSLLYARPQTRDLVRDVLKGEPTVTKIFEDAAHNELTPNSFYLNRDVAGPLESRNSLRTIHKFLEKKASEDYELSAREIAKLKALVKSI